MGKFLATKTTDMTVGDTFIYVAIVTVISFVPVIIMVEWDNIRERWTERKQRKADKEES